MEKIDHNYIIDYPELFSSIHLSLTSWFWIYLQCKSNEASKMSDMRKGANLQT